MSRVGFPLDLLRFWLDVEWDLKSAARSCTAVNGITTHGLGSRVKLYRRIQCTLSSFDSILSNLTSLQREFSKTHAGLQVDYWSLSLRFYSPDIPNFLSNSAFSSITVECHRC